MRRAAGLWISGLALTLSGLGCAGTGEQVRTAPSEPLPATVQTETPSPSPAEEVSPSAAVTTGASATAGVPAASTSPAASPEPAASTTVASADMSEWTLTTAGWGPVRLGSPLPANLRGQLTPSWECVGPIIKDKRGNELMEFWDKAEADGSGNITVLHIVSPSVSTRSGIKQGDTLAKVKQTYPKLERFHWKQDYVEEIHVLRDDATGLFFEVTDGVVEHISVQPISKFYPFELQICGSP